MSISHWFATIQGDGEAGDLVCPDCAERDRKNGIKLMALHDPDLFGSGICGCGRESKKQLSASEIEFECLEYEKRFEQRLGDFFP
jgi:hypothetical protein